MKTFNEEEMTAIILVAKAEYKKRWASAKFPASTLGSLSSWIGSQTLEISNKRKKTTHTKWDNIIMRKIFCKK